MSLSSTNETENNAAENEPVVAAEENKTEQKQKTDIGRIWGNILQLGLGDLFLKIGTALLSIALVLLVIWVMGNFYLKGKTSVQAQVAEPEENDAVPVVQVDPPPYDVELAGYLGTGIQREVILHTILPVQPRYEIATYTVQEGDTIFSIAEKFNLAPETIFWGNPYTLADDPHLLGPGQVLNILPVDGIYYEWHAGDGLNGVAEYFGVNAQSIVEYAGNNLNPDTLGDYANPNIEPGTWLVVPGGTREFINWSAPRITRDNPAVAKVYGPGYCGEVYEGPIGFGTFVWPTVDHWISGYDYSPSTNHWGVDFGGQLGNAIYAVDNGVVVYAGWNDHGYGNVVVVDHGNGWQSLYAHLNTYSVECGSYVYQGDVIAGLGTTGASSGPHLHFEMRSDEFGRVNPMNFLQ